MATAKKIPVTEYTVQLTLSPDEVDTLWAILDNIGGSPDNTRRKYASSICEGLTAAGIVRRSHKQDYSGNIYFN